MSRIGNFFLNKISESNIVLYSACENEHILVSELMIKSKSRHASLCSQSIHLDPMTYKMRYLPYAPVEKRKKQVNYE